MKKFLTLFLAIVAGLAIFAFAGCDSCGGTDDPNKGSDGNMAKVVFKKIDSAEIPFISQYTDSTNAIRDYGSKAVEGDKNYTMDDLIGSSLPYNNYSYFQFKWQSTAYTVTKVEFDIVTETAFSGKIALDISNYEADSVYYEFDLGPGVTKHVEFEVNFTKKSEMIAIGQRISSRTDSGFSAKWKLCNLYVTATKN